VQSLTLATSADPDLALVRAMADGDVAAFRALYERHGRDVFAYLLGQIADRALAEELLQDVMLAAWTAAADFRGEGRVRGWLLTIAHNRALNARRRLARGRAQALVPGLPDSSPAVARAAARAESRLDVAQALDRLSPEHRAVIVLSFYHELSVAETAGVLGIPPGTVKSRLHRAIAALRRRMAPEEVSGG
jgi:RNA polymerase sigma-70 factor (ECF subfamily)